MDNIILGLLLLRPRTIYELRKRIDEGLNLMYSCSTGSIQAAIKKLLKSGSICVNEISENGKTKKLYSITDKGKNEFDCWINGAIDNNTVKAPELAKVYFMGLSDKDSRAKLIEKHIVDMKIIYADLEKICEEGEARSKEGSNDILFYQLQTAKYGRDLMRFNIDWFDGLLKTIEGE